MSVCSYCSQPSLITVPPRRHQVCECCLRLVRHEKWEALALRWLKNHPQDWVADVAAWLECSYDRDCEKGG